MPPTTNRLRAYLTQQVVQPMGSTATLHPNSSSKSGKIILVSLKVQRFRNFVIYFFGLLLPPRENEEGNADMSLIVSLRLQTLTERSL